VANGKPGDHPVTDIVTWNRQVYGPELDGLVREVFRLLGKNPPRDEKGRPRDPLNQNPILELLFAAETEPARRPDLERELLALRRELRGPEPTRPQDG
jgi:hypothetical protein